MSDKISTLEDLKISYARHIGEVDTLWAAQLKINDTLRKDFDKLKTDMGKEMRDQMYKILMAIGIVAAAGAAFGGWVGGS